jgi:hypothetical protein
MPADLSKHMPIGNGFEEAGHQFKAWQPANGEAKRVLILQAFKGDELAHEREVPMDFRNIFGIDVADMAALEAATDDLIRELNGQPD